MRDDLDLDEALISHGEHCCTVESAMARLGRSESATRSVIQRLLNQRRLFSPARGFYVVVPADYRAWDVVPATYFVDSLMKHLGRRYYVALLSAAEVHGAAHQRPMVFQVMVDRPTPNRAFERVRFVFCEKVMAPTVATATVQKTTPTGRMTVSSPELTVVDLAARPVESAGVDNLATIIIEMVDDNTLDPTRFAAVAAVEQPAAVRRAGWMIENLTPLRLDETAAAVRWSEPLNLDMYGKRRGTVDRRWGIRINTVLDPDV